MSIDQISNDFVRDIAALSPLAAVYLGLPSDRLLDDLSPRGLAEQGLILRTQVGSGVHGTSISGQDDRDEMGICLEPPAFVTGLVRVPNGIRGEEPSVAFEQYERPAAGMPLLNKPYRHRDLVEALRQALEEV